MMVVIAAPVSYTTQLLRKLMVFAVSKHSLTNVLVLLKCLCQTRTAGSFSVESIRDDACYAVGGPPPSKNNVVGDSNNQCACSDSFASFVAYYQTIVSQSFTDNILSMSRSLVPLWQYQTSENMDAGNKPATVIRAATSIPDDYVQVNLQEAAYAYTFPASEMSEIYDIYNGAVSQGQRTDTVTEVELWMESGIN